MITQGYLFFYRLDNHLSNIKKQFIESFSNIYDKKLMYILGLFQIHKRGDGKIVDGRNLAENETFQNFTDNIIEWVSKFL